MGTACEKVLRVLEFYSGIGGMRYSLKESGIQATIVEAFDINNIANEVYKHNFGHSPYQGNIQSLSVGQLEKFQADAWLLSPPCQPYTRQGLQKDADDARACSFLKLLELIPRISFPPAYLLMENVVGFETSLTHQKMIEVLQQNEYITQEFILTPLQFGIPYSRPRYFCLAKRQPLSFCFPNLNGKLVLNASHVLEGSLTCLLEVTSSPGEINEYEYSRSCRPIKDFLQADLFRISTSGYRVTSSSLQLKTDEIMTIEKYNGMDQHCNGCNMETIGKEEVSESESYVVSSELIERWGDAMDIVFPDSKRCCCFTKSYGRYVKGTGSLLATSEASVNGISINENNWKQFTNTKCSVMQNLKLRYFTPREIANLHSLPEDFSFPSHLSQKQRYALLGNSISVAVVAPLLKYLFTQ